MNAAEYLLSYFETQSAAQSQNRGFRFPDIVSALEEIESAINLWDKAGLNVDLMRDCLTRWKLSALRPFTDSGSELHWKVERHGGSTTREELSSGDLMGLQTVADRLAASSISYPENAREKISNLIQETVNCLKEDTGLPQELVLYVAQLIEEARRSLDEYDISGDFRLSIAFDRLSNAINVVEVKSDKKDIWSNLRKEFIIPLLGQIVVNSMVWGLTAAHVLPQIGS
ncbi:MAG: hypothetical protein ABF453_03040 [Bifidobacterium psychraerophilum]|uniref:hypothetical protein n=1 Tax=Bifidobacterium psychraerophilum TaxID=218140 RepID=UPI0039EBAFA8